MLVSVEGLEQGTIETELSILPRKGETIRIFYGPDAEVEGEIENVHHIVNQPDGGHKVIIKIRPTF